MLKKITSSYLYKKKIKYIRNLTHCLSLQTTSMSKSEDFIEQFKIVKRYVSKIYMVITQAINYIPLRPLNYRSIAKSTGKQIMDVYFIRSLVL